jgi:hypothetical protein
MAAALGTDSLASSFRRSIASISHSSLYNDLSGCLYPRRRVRLYTSDWQDSMARESSQIRRDISTDYLSEDISHVADAAESSEVTRNECD